MIKVAYGVFIGLPLCLWVFLFILRAEDTQES